MKTKSTLCSCCSGSHQELKRSGSGGIYISSPLLYHKLSLPQTCNASIAKNIPQGTKLDTTKPFPAPYSIYFDRLDWVTNPTVSTPTMERSHTRQRFPLNSVLYVAEQKGHLTEDSPLYMGCRQELSRVNGFFSS